MVRYKSNTYVRWQMCQRCHSVPRFVFLRQMDTPTVSPQMRTAGPYARLDDIEPNEDRRLFEFVMLISISWCHGS